MKAAIVRVLEGAKNEYRTLGIFFYNKPEDLIQCVDETEDADFCEYLPLNDFSGCIYVEEKYTAEDELKFNSGDYDELSYSPFSNATFDLGRKFSEGISESIFNAVQGAGWIALCSEDESDTVAH